MVLDVRPYVHVYASRYLLPALVVDPAAATAATTAGFTCEARGSLFDKFTYTHTVATRRPGVTRLRLVPVPGRPDDVQVDMAVNTATVLGERPKWVAQLFAEGAESEAEQEAAFKLRSVLLTDAFTAAADGSSPVLAPGERSALDELRHGWSRDGRVGQWRRALRVLFDKGCSGLARRSVLFPSDDVIHAVHELRRSQCVRMPVSFLLLAGSCTTTQRID